MVRLGDVVPKISAVVKKSDRHKLKIQDIDQWVISITCLLFRASPELFRGLSRKSGPDVLTSQRNSRLNLKRQRVTHTVT